MVIIGGKRLVLQYFSTLAECRFQDLGPVQDLGSAISSFQATFVKLCLRV